MLRPRIARALSRVPARLIPLNRFARSRQSVAAPARSAATASHAALRKHQLVTLRAPRAVMTRVVPHRRYASLPSHTKVAMPALSPTMTKGNVGTWKKKEGDAVKAGEVLCEIETDKANMTLEAADDGFLAKILIPSGSQDVPLGQTLAVIVDDKGSVAQFANFKGDGAPAAHAKAPTAPPSQTKTAAAPPAAAVPSSAPQKKYPPHVKVDMPALSPTMTQGNVGAWKKKEGDAVKAGEVLCEIETDKATMTLEASDEGFIARILVPAQSKDVPLGRTLALIVDEKALVSQFKDYVDAPKGAIPSAAAPVPASAAKATPGHAATTFSDMHVNKEGLSPAVLHLVATHHVDVSKIRGSGPKGRILKGDVLAFLNGTAPAQGAPAVAKVPSPAAASATSSAAYEDIPNNNIRKVIARRLSESKGQIPHVYHSQNFDIDLLNEQRNLFIKAGTKLSVNDFVVRAAALALRDVPAVNITVQGDAIRQWKSVNISIAVATDKGLITPIIRNADRKQLLQISKDSKELSVKARDGKLKPEEFNGGSFSISNLGMFGIKEFSAVINPPQGAILAVGTSQTVIVPDEKTGKPRAKTIMNATLSADGRAIDEDLAAHFMDVFGKYISNPTRMLL